MPANLENSAVATGLESSLKEGQCKKKKKFNIFYLFESQSVVSDSLWPHGLHSPWNSPGQNTGVGSRSLLQGIFPTQGSNPGLLHCRRIIHQLSHQGSPRMLKLQQLHSSLVAQRLKRLPAMQETRGSIPESGRSPGEGSGNSLQYSCVENPM